MTNVEKFEEVFGFKPSREVCLLPDGECHPNFHSNFGICEGCSSDGWWDREYKQVVHTESEETDADSN